jgi:RNA polymerase sigma-70 factor (ECF subfamily)
MTALVTRYGMRPPAEWAPLFHRILQNRIRDWSRRRALRDRWRAWLGRADDVAAETDPIAEIPDSASPDPADRAEFAAAARQLDAALRTLPLRQQQAFLLRTWEGLDVAETAAAMRCSQGSVKTHYFRAIQSLRGRLGDDWS